MDELKQKYLKDLLSVREQLLLLERNERDLIAKLMLFDEQEAKQQTGTDTAPGLPGNE